jgi:hypothetical protein
MLRLPLSKAAFAFAVVAVFALTFAAIRTGSVEGERARPAAAPTFTIPERVATIQNLERVATIKPMRSVAGSLEDTQVVGPTPYP